MARPVKPRPIEIPIGPSIAYVPLTQGLYALIDAEDVPRVQDYAWHAAFNRTSGHFYARRRMGNARMPLHDAILGRVDGKTADHVRQDDTLDNRRCNLRHASAGDQCCNRKLMRHNTSGYRGVYWDAKKKHWKGIIVHQGSRISLGTSKSKAEVAMRYDRAALQLRGAFAQLNLGGA